MLINLTDLFRVAVLSSMAAAPGWTLFVRNTDEFDRIVQNQPYALVVVSKRSGCPSCERYEQILQDNLKEMEDMYQCSLTIVRDNDEIVKRYGIDQVPRVMFFREGIPAIYNSAELLPSDLLYWVHKARDARVQILDDTIFEHLTQATSGATTGDWLVAFVSQETPALRAKFEGVQATFMGHATNVAIVDYVKNLNLKKRFAIEQDVVLFFKRGIMYRFIGTKWDAKALVDFVAQTHHHVKAESIPLESSTFDYFLDTSVRLVREKMEPLARQYFKDIQEHPLGFAAALSAIIIAIFASCFVVRKGNEKAKQKTQ
ncbi:hypothetical protein BIW11_07352 [Tropilaelaps mercedesae]|uniref:Thioredoxin domain-containing protein n=1 Tax=Tropilaelaps mercedesae TaxID=418985 RepID=A0A1V9XUG5_9ACAR|nr:hypothetical protein BIW11_07352 [Tropilaelaps mercedesae]